MKITWLVNNINQMGGVERVVCNLSSIFVSENLWEVDILSLSSEKSSVFFPIDCLVKIYHYNMGALTQKKLIKEMKGILGELDSDILITCHSYIYAAVILNKRYYQGKVIATQHNAWDYDTTKRILLNALLYRFSEQVVFLTEKDKTKYKSLGVKNSVVIPNGIRMLPEKTSDLNSKVILSMGRLTEVKRIDVLIDAYALVKEQHPLWKLKIVGTGEQEHNIKKQICKLNLEENVEMIGFVKDIEKEFTESGLFVNTSRSEGFSLTLLEAMAYGVPVISSNVGAAAELLNHEEGVLIDSLNSDKYANAICTLIDSEEKRKRISKQEKEKIKSYTLKKINVKWKNLVNRIIDENNCKGEKNA